MSGPRIRNYEWVELHPTRWAVWRNHRGEWRAGRGWEVRGDFGSHADAIAYANQRARQEATR